MKSFYILLFNMLCILTPICGQLKNTVFSMAEFHRLNFLSFYSETDGFLFQKFNEDLNINEQYNQYVTFFRYEIKKIGGEKKLYIYSQKHFPTVYQFLPDSAFVNSKLMNRIVPRALNDPPHKAYEYSGWFFNLPDTCILEILDKNTIVHVLPNGPKERQLGCVWIYERK